MLIKPELHIFIITEFSMQKTSFNFCVLNNTVCLISICYVIIVLNLFAHVTVYVVVITDTWTAYVLVLSIGLLIWFLQAWKANCANLTSL